MVPPATLVPNNLRCEYVANPLGIDSRAPHLSWQLKAGRRAERQTAWQVLVARKEITLEREKADVWDSGRVESDQQIGIVYDGEKLKPGERVYWKVRVWDRERHVSEWSETAWWEMGQFQQSVWQGSWIENTREQPQTPEEFYQDQPAPLFRHEFTLTKPVKQARAYVSGLGYYELRLNGKRIGDHLLDPAWTSYGKRVPYCTYDVTNFLNKGANAVGAIVGNGWYNLPPMTMFSKFVFRDHLTSGFPRIILNLDVEYADGTYERIVTDETWKVSDSPVLRNCIYLGEKYDARLIQPGWDKPKFDDSAWRPARIAESPVGPLRAQLVPPIRVTAKVVPVAITEPKPGVYIFDMGQNFAGRVRLSIRGAAGQRIDMRFGELLNADGTLNYRTTCCTQIKEGICKGGTGAPIDAVQQDTYILKGAYREEWTPRFTFHGFRYVEVTGLTSPPGIEMIEGQRMNSDVKTVGQFACSNEMFRHLHSVIHWTQLSNMFSVQSDCPGRERLGYGGDIVAASEMGMLNLDMTQFYAKTVRDFADDVRPNGGFTEIAPDVGINEEGLGDGTGPIGWGIVHPLLVWQLYQYYGNGALMNEQYPLAARYVDFLESQSIDDILDADISDHLALEGKPTALTSTAFYYLGAKLVARMAGELEKVEDQEHYAKLAERIHAGFNKRFLHPGTGVYDTGTQTCQAFALYFGLVPAEERAAAIDHLLAHIAGPHKGHLSTGIFGTKYLFDVLTETGHADIAYAIADQRDYPGYGYMLANGATTLWEEWGLETDIPSHNHPMFGSVDEWFYKSLGGIAPAPDAVGFHRIIVRPQIVGGLTWARTKYQSVLGEVACEWERDGDTITLTVTVPTGAIAKIYLPCANPADVTEANVPTADADGVMYMGTEPGVAIYRVGGGRYRFKAGL